MAFSTGEPNRDIVLQSIASRDPGPAIGTVRHESMPRFAPDGKSIVYVSGPTSTRNELYVQRVRDGLPVGEPEQLTDHGEGEVDHPAVSKDGRWVAYYRVVNGQRDIWTIPLRGGAPVRITTDMANDIQPAWSPDGSRLAFVSDRGGGLNIWTVPVANGAKNGTEVRVTRVDGQAQAPEWSPGDGKWIAWVAGPKSTESEVWVSRADGSSARPVTSGAGAFRVRWVREDVMVVGGTWGGPTLSLRLVDPATGASTAFDPPLVIGDEPAMCDFDIDLDRKLALFGRKSGQGHIMTLSKR
jgi:Tol biopolymer transport system component